jgi:hypothetical protein
MDAGEFVNASAAEGLRLSRYLGNSPRLRAVTHHGVDSSDIDDALEVIAKVLSLTRTPVGAAD